MIGGTLIFVALIAGAIFVFFRGPGRRLLLGSMPGARSRSQHISQLTDRSMSIGGPFSAADFGGFGGARRQRN